MKSSQLFLILALMIAAFFAGAAWKTSDSTNQNNSEAIEEQSVFANSQVREAAPPKDLMDNELATVNLFSSSTPSVVYITALNLRRNSWSRNVMEIPSGSGSGFVWNQRGYIVTNFHVIRDGEKFQVTLSDQNDLGR